MARLSQKLISFLNDDRASNTEARVMVAYQFPDKFIFRGSFEGDKSLFPTEIKEIEEFGKSALEHLNRFRLGRDGTDQSLFQKSRWENIELGGSFVIDITKADLETLEADDRISYISLVGYLEDKDKEKGGEREGSKNRITKSCVLRKGDLNLVEYINATRLWEKGVKGQGIYCAVIDSGIRDDHPDLSHAFEWASGHYSEYDFDPYGISNQEHGTAVAGIIAAKKYKGIPIGVAPEANLIGLRVPPNDPIQLKKAFQRAISLDHVDVICMSQTIKRAEDPNHVSWRNLCASALSYGKLHVNSSGNQGDLACNDAERDYNIPQNIYFPGNCPPPFLVETQRDRDTGGVSSSITVGSVAVSKKQRNTIEEKMMGSSGMGPCDWSQYETNDYQVRNLEQCKAANGGLIKPDLCAPGKNVPTVNWAYIKNITCRHSTFEGSSAATPFVAGALCLLVHARRSRIGSSERLNPVIFQRVLEASCVPIEGQRKLNNRTVKVNHKGAGRIDVSAAFNEGKSIFWD